MMSPTFTSPIFDAHTGLQYYPASQLVPSPPSYEVIPNRVFVGGFSVSTTEFELREFFEQFVHVREAKIVKTDNGSGKNYGFITVDSERDADYLRKLGPEYMEFHGKTLNLGPALRKISPKYLQEYAVATPNGLVSPGPYRAFPQYPVPPPTPSYVVFPPQVSPTFMYNVHPATVPQMAAQHQENTGFIPEQQQHTPINNRMNAAGQDAAPRNTSTPLKSVQPTQAQITPTYPPMYYVGQNNQIPVTPFYATPPEGIYTPPQSAHSQEMYYTGPNLATGDGSSVRLGQQRIFTWNTPTRDQYGSSPVTPRTPQRSQPTQLSTPPPLCETLNRQSPAVRRINVYGNDGSKDSIQTQVQGTSTSMQKNGKRASEGPAPVKLENRQRGPDGRFKTTDNAQYQFIRTPPSDTKSLPPPRPQKINSRGSKCVQSLTKKFANLDTDVGHKEDSELFASGDHKHTLSAPVTPRRRIF